MSEQNETSENVAALAHSDGEPDQTIRHGEGSDVGGPAGTLESSSEDSLNGTTEDDDDEQTLNPA